MFGAWVRLYPGDGWEPRGKHQQPGFEQFEFNKHLLTRLGVALVREEDFCSRLSKGTTPLVHFYGHCQFAGKAAIGSYATRICGALSREQRKCVPEFKAWVYAFVKRSRSAAAKEFLGDRSNSAAAVRRSLGNPVVLAGAKYPSVRAAAAATGLHRNTITAHVNVRKRPACSGAAPASKPRRSTPRASSAAKLATRRRRLAISG